MLNENAGDDGSVNDAVAVTETKATNVGGPALVIRRSAPLRVRASGATPCGNDPAPATVTVPEGPVTAGNVIDAVAVPALTLATVVDELLSEVVVDCGNVEFVATGTSGPLPPPPQPAAIAIDAIAKAVNKTLRLVISLPLAAERFPHLILRIKKDHRFITMVLRVTQASKVPLTCLLGRQGCRFVIAGNDVRERSAGLRDPALHFGGQHGLCGERLSREFCREPRIGMVATRVKIHCGIAGFRPRVNRDMRLGENDHAGDALRFETMERDFHNSRSRCPCRADHHLADRIDVGECLGITARELTHDVRTQCLQFLRSP